MTAHAVVVGAGPAGALSALLLARSGVSVTLVERNATMSTASHASTFHPSTLDLLTTLGVDLAADPDAVRVDSVQWRDHRGWIRAEISYRLLDGLTGHPFRIHLDQQALLDRLAMLIAAEAGVEFRPGVSVTGLDPRRPGVTAASGEHLAADVVIGCDGAHSTVRAASGIAFPVTGYPTAALRARVTADLDALLPSQSRPLSGLCYFRGGGDGISVLRMATDTRLIVRTTGARSERDRVAEAVANATPFDDGDLDIGAIDSYVLQRGVVEDYLCDDAPVLVLGDAAHVTSTAGGLNMNSGIHDAFALMPVVADWLHGRAPRESLAVAAAARRAYIADAVIPRSERRVAGLQDGDPDALRAHLADVAALAADPVAARRFLIEASLLDQHCAPQVGAP